MKDFVEKLIERLEEASHWENPEYDEDGYADETWEVVYLDKAIKIVNQLAEEYGKDTNVTTNCRDCAGCTLWKCDCANIRECAITEFAETLKADVMAKTFGLRVCDVDRIADKLRAVDVHK